MLSEFKVIQVTTLSILTPSLMGWQHTFNLEKRAKGCHLITDEVISHILPGLENVKASTILN